MRGSAARALSPGWRQLGEVPQLISLGFLLLWLWEQTTEIFVSCTGGQGPMQHLKRHWGEK